jgi:RNA polymerase sigma factor (sigma-70 family)
MKRAAFETKNENSVASVISEENLESRSIQTELMEKLEHAEQALPTDLQQTWKLRKQGLDYQQIANKLAIPIGTVKSRFHRLTEHLKKEFKNES